MMFFWAARYKKVLYSQSFGTGNQPKIGINSHFDEFNHLDIGSLLPFQISRKKDQEISKLRSHLEALTNENEEAVISVTKKFNSQLLQVQEEIESIRKSKARLGLSDQIFEGAEGAELLSHMSRLSFCTHGLWGEPP